MRNVLLDANLLIGVFDTHDAKAEAHFEQLERLYADYQQEVVA